MLRPLNNEVVVEPVKPEATLSNGVILTEDASKNYNGLRAVVIAVGPGLYTLSGVLLPVALNKGDVVILRNAGPLVRDDGKTYCIVSERDVLCVVEGGPPVKPCEPQFKEAKRTPNIIEHIPIGG